MHTIDASINTHSLPGICLLSLSISQHILATTLTKEGHSNYEIKIYSSHWKKEEILVMWMNTASKTLTTMHTHCLNML